jgi:hypothetical protein
VSPHPGESPARPGTTADGLIASALAAGRIDYPTSLVYRVQAAFGSPALPAEFRTEMVDWHAATFALAEVAANESKLSADQLATLEPYRVRPNEPASIFNREPSAALGRVAATAQWASLPAADGRARVWVKVGSLGEVVHQALATATTQAWQTVFDKRTALHASLIPPPNPDEAGVPSIAANPDAAIDVYFVAAGSVDTRLPCPDLPAPGCVLEARGGYTNPVGPFSDRSSSAYLVIDEVLTDALLSHHVAHELAHASQFGLDYLESSWLLDATAEWVAFRALQLSDESRRPAHAYLPTLFASLASPLNNNVGLNRYASWLYIHSLAIDHGDEVARRVFEAMAIRDVSGVQAIDRAYPFESNFGTFAVSNWNRDTADRYRRNDASFPDSLHPTDTVVSVSEPGVAYELRAEVEPLAAVYHRVKVGPSLRQLVINNRLAEPIAACACIPSVWLIARIRDTWKTPVEFRGTERRYCRDRLAEEVTEVIVIVANTGLAGGGLPVDRSPMVRGSEEPCGSGGVVEYSRVKNGTYTSARGNPVTVELNEHATITFEIEADPDSPGSYKTTGSTITWTRRLTAIESGECDVIEREEGSGSWSGFGGPNLTFGWELDESGALRTRDGAYVLTVVAPELEVVGEDPSAFYRSTSAVCDLMPTDVWLPFGVFGMADGIVPDNGSPLSGHQERSIPSALPGDDVPTIERIHWEISFGGS